MSNEKKERLSDEQLFIAVITLNLTIITLNLTIY